MPHYLESFVRNNISKEYASLPGIFCKKQHIKRICLTTRNILFESCEQKIDINKNSIHCVNGIQNLY